ncbi:hypothetical protein LXA43DRAFT_877996 [Ganoderma leucocontextum]|nr:hypothetical protein LXA43DRAFT_877996 [Ganoderma leucocontextum]
MIPGMSQPPNHAGPVQATPYAGVHRQHPGAYGLPQPAPNAYQQHPQHPHSQPHHVIQYVPGPPHPGHAPQGHTSELMYSVEPSQQSQSQGQSQAGQSQSQVQAEPQEEEEDEPPPPPASTNGKRKQPDSATPDAGAKKRRQRSGAAGASAGGGAGAGEDGEDGQDLEVGPNGGAKHWTEEEKTRFFTWMLTSDEHWDAFKTRMNTVFRECSAELFPGRKSYTALKSCYHRNLEVFKQIHAFQNFSTNHVRQLQVENPHAEQPSVESMLDVARVAGLNVGNLNIKAIDRWYETGWYNLFKKRYREDPKTGLPAPYYGPPDEPTDPGPSSSAPPMMGLHTTIDPQLMAGHSAQASQETQYVPPPGEGSQQSVSAMVPGGPYSYSSPSRPSYYREAGPSAASQPPPASQSFQYLRSQSAVPPKVLPGASSQPLRPPAANGQRHSPFPEHPSGGDQYVADYHPQTAHAVSQLTAMAGSLLGVCSSIKDLLQQQVEESKARTELMRAEAASKRQNGGGGEGQPKEREKEISMEKVTFATEILKNGPQNDEIKKAAIECLTKYLMRDL